MVTLPEPESETKCLKPTTSKNDAFVMALSAEPYKSFCYSEVLIWFRDGTIRVGH